MGINSETGSKIIEFRKAIAEYRNADDAPDEAGAATHDSVPE